MDILSELTSLLSGGITGILGSVVSSVYAFKSKQLDVELQKQKYANEIELKKADAAIMAQEWAARTQISKTTADAQADMEDSKAFAASLTSEPQRYSEGALTTKQNWFMVVLDFIRGIIRPGLTIYLSVLTTLIYFQARALLSGPVTIEVAIGLTTRIIDTVLYLCSTCILFWFGSRIHEKR